MASDEAWPAIGLLSMFTAIILGKTRFIKSKVHEFIFRHEHDMYSHVRKHILREEKCP